MLADAIVVNDTHYQNTRNYHYKIFIVSEIIPYNT